MDWTTPTLTQFGPIDGCGCPMEEWVYFGIVLIMHFEATGEVDVYFDAGDWQHESSFPNQQAAFDWVDALPTEEQIAGQ